MLLFAYLTGKRALPLYAHRCSPKKFTQPQLFACLVLKEFLRLDYRKLVPALLLDTPDLCEVIELKQVPHFTTFQKAARRLLLALPARRLLDETIRIGVAARWTKKRVLLAAVDGTGFESHHASSYYVRRRESQGKFRGKWHSLTYRRFPKAGILCDCVSHIILAMTPGQGPAPDILHFREILDQAARRVRIITLCADAGYDSEASHVYARSQHAVRSLIPPLIGRRTEKPPSGYWRRWMKARLHTTRYSQRWQVETVHSMLKRLMDSALRARNYWSRCREIILRGITLNIMILRRAKVFYRAGQPPFFCPFQKLRPSRGSIFSARGKQKTSEICPIFTLPSATVHPNRYRPHPKRPDRVFSRDTCPVNHDWFVFLRQTVPRPPASFQKRCSKSGTSWSVKKMRPMAMRSGASPNPDFDARRSGTELRRRYCFPPHIREQ